LERRGGGRGEFGSALAGKLPPFPAAIPERFVCVKSLLLCILTRTNTGGDTYFYALYRE
jgi:hypothetical protein